jgi:hypothetical protein
VALGCFSSLSFGVGIPVPDWLRAPNKEGNQQHCVALDRGLAAFRVRCDAARAALHGMIHPYSCIAEALRGKAATASSSISWCTLLWAPCARCVDERPACSCAWLTRYERRSGLRAVKASRCQSCRGRQRCHNLHLHAHWQPSRLLPVRLCSFAQVQVKQPAAHSARYHQEHNPRRKGQPRR